MSLFGNKKRELNDLFSDEEIETDELLEPVANYNTVIEYLSGLSAEDYKKVIKCADITRKSYADQCKVLGIDNEPTTFINPPEDELQTMPPVEVAGSFLDYEEDDTALGNFLDDEPPVDEPPAKVKINKTEKPKK